MTIKGQIEIEIEKDNFLEEEKKKVPIFYSYNSVEVKDIKKQGYRLRFCSDEEVNSYYTGFLVRTETNGAVILIPNAKTEDDIKNILNHYA